LRPQWIRFEPRHLLCREQDNEGCRSRDSPHNASSKTSPLCLPALDHGDPPCASCNSTRLARGCQSGVFGKIVNVRLAHKYARIERERRFLVEQFPAPANVVGIRSIKDLYIDNTALRLREQTEDTGAVVFKLTQKIPARGPGAQQGFITNMYLSKEEFRVLAQLSGKKLRKTRYSLPPFGIDVFEGELAGLLLAEAEFDSADAADSLTLPSF